MARLSTQDRPLDEDQPDPQVLWRWVWSSVRPVLGYVVVALGLVLLLAAYLGVSREVLVAKQLPYLVSGGLFGLAAVTLGSRLMLIEDLRRDAGRLDRLERAVTELHSVLLARPDAPLPATSHVALNGAAAHHATSRMPGSEQLTALTGGDSFHRDDCPLVQGKASAQPLTATTARRKGLTACPMCQPLVVGV